LKKYYNETMKARLIGYTQPVNIIGIDNAQDLIAFCARVSNPANQLNTETGEKLIKYLINHKHWSPLEMASATLEIETTRDIARQILRHRSFSFQEYSTRYADPTIDLDFVIREARLQDTKNRQNSVKTEDDTLQKQWAAKQQQIIHESILAYKWAIENGIAKEQARVVLPEGNTVSRLYMHGTLRSWVHYIELRSGNGTQLEHIEVAKATAYALAKCFPMIDDVIQNK
jgi:thymidylate synthase (FAD)